MTPLHERNQIWQNSSKKTKTLIVTTWTTKGQKKQYLKAIQKRPNWVEHPKLYSFEKVNDKYDCIDYIIAGFLILVYRRMDKL